MNMNIRRLYDNLRGKTISVEEIQRFLNRKNDYVHMPAEKIEQLVLGASVAAYGIYPPAFSVYTWNAGEVSADLFTNYHLARFMLDRCPRLKRIVLLYSFYNKGLDLSKTNEKKLSILYSLFIPGIPFRRVSPRSLYWGMRLKIRRYKNLRPNCTPYADGMYFPNIFGTESDMHSILAKHIKTATKYGTAPWQYFLKLANVCRERKVQLVVCFPPQRSDYYKAWQESQDNADLFSRFTSLHIPVIDARNWISDDLFGDFYHLKLDGAKHFSALLEKALPTLA